MKKEFLKTLKSFNLSKRRTEIFSDFLELITISIINAFDLDKYQERENIYFQLIRKYSSDDQNRFAKLFSILILALDNNVKESITKDFLGEIYEELDMASKIHQQYFTPNSISALMANLIFNPNRKENLNLNEPCCGSGRLILNYVQILLNNKINYQKNLIVYATDISKECVYMTYIQLSLYGISAVVSHADTLKNEIYDTFITPAYYFKMKKE